MQFISFKKLAVRRDYSVRTLRRVVHDDPNHPRPVATSPGRKAFVEPECDEYDLSLIAERDAALAKNGEDAKGQIAEVEAKNSDRDTRQSVADGEGQAEANPA